LYGWIGKLTLANNNEKWKKTSKKKKRGAGGVTGGGEKLSKPVDIYTSGNIIRARHNCSGDRRQFLIHTPECRWTPRGGGDRAGLGLESEEETGGAASVEQNRNRGKTQCQGGLTGDKIFENKIKRVLRQL